MTHSLKQGWLDYQQSQSHPQAIPYTTTSKTYDSSPLCAITRCAKHVRMHRTAKRPYSKYCVDHAQHALRHGHPVLKMPKISPTASFEPRCAYLAGKAWIKKNKDREDVKPLLEEIEWEVKVLRNWKPPSRYRRAGDMKKEERWKWYRHHLLVTHEVSPLALLQHHVGLLAVLMVAPRLFANERMQHQFLAYRFIRLKQLPKHGADAYSGKTKQHQSLDLGTAEWIHQRLVKLWDRLPASISQEIALLIKQKTDERIRRKEAWTLEGRMAMAEKARARQRAVIKEYRCMTTGAVIGQLQSGRKKVISRGLATEEQLRKWGVE